MKALKNKIIVRSVSDNGIIKDKKTGLYLVSLLDNGSADQFNFGTVEAISDGEDEIQIGDTVMVHHNAFHNKAGNRIDSDKNLYALDKEHMVYCYIRSGKIHMVSEFVFMIPVEVDNKITAAGIYLPFLKGARRGVIKYMGKPIEDNEGLSVGDTVMYTKAADYEIEVEGERMYRMKQNRILAKVG